MLSVWGSSFAAPLILCLRALTLLSPNTKKGGDCKGIYALPIILAFGEYKVRQD
jgi:hypothetical protein